MTPPVSQACGYWGLMRGVWHHQDRRRRGPRELTGIVDLTRGEDHPTARLLDLVPGRSGTVYKNWLEERGEDFRSGIQIATLDPFQGYKNAIDDQLQDATSVLDAFHIVKLAGDALDEVRRRVQQDTTGHRGRKGDPLYQIRLLLHASRHKLTPRQQERLREAFTADEAHISVEVAYHCAGKCARSSTKPHPPKADAWPHTSSSTYQPAPSPKSPAWAEPYANGRTHSTPTSTQPEPATHHTETINRHHRTRKTHRQRLPQPHQLPTPNAPHHRRPRHLPTPNYAKP